MSKNARQMTFAETENKFSWRGKSLSDRRAQVLNIYVNHPQCVHAISEIMRRSERVKDQAIGAALLVICPTGGGKTKLAEVIMARWPDEEEVDRTIRRCVYFSVPPKPSSASMSSAALKALGDPLWKKGRSDVLLDRVIHLCRECKTEIILLDNTHDIPERRGAKGIREVGNWLRDIIDSVPAMFVSLGAEQGLDVFKANSQSRRRSPAVVRIDYFDCNTPRGVARFRRFLHEVDIQLPLAELSNLGEFDITKRIWIATNGVPDYIMKLLMEAIEIVVKNNREKIESDDLKLAFSRLYEDGCSEINPFVCPSSDLRILDQSGEPFEDWLNDGYE